MAENKKGSKGTAIKKAAAAARKAKAKTKANQFNFIRAFSNTGNISHACSNANIGRRTFYNWMKNDEAFKLSFEDAEDDLIDFAEGKLFKLIDEKNVPAVIFFLKTKGKERGYIEPTYMNIQANMKHTHTHQLSMREIRKSYDRISRKIKKRS